MKKNPEVLKNELELQSKTAACARDITYDPGLLLSPLYVTGLEVTEEEMVFDLIYGGPTVCAYLEGHVRGFYIPKNSGDRN